MRAAGLYDADADYRGAIPAAVEEIVKVFAAQGHSGGSAAVTLRIVEKLLRFEPLVPLTGAEEEWVEVMEGIWQNKRCGRVFKEADGQAYDIEGKVFTDEHECSFTNRESRVPVTFPYTPRTRFVRVTSDSRFE